jgi:hypothetical protein
MKVWTEEKLQTAKKLCAQHTSVEAVLSALELKYDQKLGISQFRAAFKKRFGNLPTKYLLKQLPVHHVPEVPPSESPIFLKRRITQLEKELKLAHTNSEYAAIVKSICHGGLQHENQQPAWIVPEKNAHPRHGTPTLLISDIHHGETVVPGEVNFANKFDLDISRTRIKRVFQRSIYLTDTVLTPCDYDGIYLVLGGDILSGNIHEELRETNQVGVAEAMLDVADCLENGIKLLQERFRVVNVPCVVGNHARFDKKPRYKKGPSDNFEYILYHLLKARFKDNPNVHIHVSDSFTAFYTVNGTRYMLTHGDEFKGGSGIAGPATPWALGDHKLRKQLASMERWTGRAHEYDVLVFCHFHQLTFMDNIIVNGSIKGFDEFCKKNNYPFQLPMQAFWFTTQDRGITLPMRIFAEDPPNVSRATKLEGWTK